MKKFICSICGKNDTKIIRKHLYSFIECKDCEHSYLLTTIENHEKFVKELFRRSSINKDYSKMLEYSFCPYCAIAKNLGTFIVPITKECSSIQIQYFSEKSIKKMLAEIPHSLEISDGNAIIKIQR